MRVNPDEVVNDYGSKLLSLCKSSGLRILNGRHTDIMDRDYTVMGARVLSVDDYCISTPDVFYITEQFIVASFTVFFLIMHPYTFNLNVPQSLQNDRQRTVIYLHLEKLNGIKATVTTLGAYSFHDWKTFILFQKI